VGGVWSKKWDSEDSFNRQSFVIFLDNWGKNGLLGSGLGGSGETPVKEDKKKRGIIKIILSGVKVRRKGKNTRT